MVPAQTHSVNVGVLGIIALSCGKLSLLESQKDQLALGEWDFSTENVTQEEEGYERKEKHDSFLVQSHDEFFFVHESSQGLTLRD